MTKIITYAILVASSFSAYGQEIFTISLAKFSVQSDSISFKISEIIDARKDNKVVGIIQRGVKNRKDLAVFERPGIQELEDLMNRSNLISKENGVIMRISRLYISELTAMWKETAKAELSADFFIHYKGNYYYITSVYETIETRGSDVTQYHAENIASVIGNALVQFSTRAHEVSSEQPYSKEDLTDPSENFRPISTMPIVQTADYKDGYYTTFEEFLTNEPSISIDCAVKLNEPTVVKCGREEKEVSVYGFAKDNQLFIAFHQEFYPLTKINNEFIFYGPREMTGKDIEDAYKGMIIPRQLGKRGHSARYAIDLTTGSIKNETGF